MKRVALAASHVIRYQDPFFPLLAADPQIDLTVFYCSRAGPEVYRDEDMKTSLRRDIDLHDTDRGRYHREVSWFTEQIDELHRAGGICFVAEKPESP